MKNISPVAEFKANLKRGFTLVELIVVMVIIAILGGVGFNAFANYINESKLVKVLNEYDATLQALPKKFAKDFTDSNGAVTYKTFDIATPVDFMNGGTIDQGAMLGAQFVSAQQNAAALNAIPSFVVINGEQIPTIDVGNNNGLAMVNPTEFKQSNLDKLLVIEEPAFQDGAIKAKLFKKITDVQLCESDAVFQGYTAMQSNNKYIMAINGLAPGCVLVNWVNPELTVFNPGN